MDEEMRIADLLTDRHSMFVLWLLEDGLCIRRADFHYQYGADWPSDALIDRLKEANAVNEVYGRLRVTELGRQIVSNFSAQPTSAEENAEHADEAQPKRDPVNSANAASPELLSFGTSYSEGWNIFAVVLRHLLSTRGFELSKIGSTTGAAIHYSKIQSLKLSIEHSSSFPVLNPEEIERVFSAFQMTEDERMQLHAALLATGTERLLMDRIAPDSARAASWEIFNLILLAFRSGDTELSKRLLPRSTA